MRGLLTAIRLVIIFRRSIVRGDAADTTLPHYAQLNPLSAPFWSRMGYRPLRTGWEVRPAGSLR